VKPAFACRWLPRVSAFAGLRFGLDVIMVAVRRYLRYGLSYRDVEELPVERGVDVDHVGDFRWVQRFIPPLADAARFARRALGDRWFVDETYVKVRGVWRYVYRPSTGTGRSSTYSSRPRYVKIVPWATPARPMIPGHGLALYGPDSILLGGEGTHSDWIRPSAGWVVAC
jgi:hypothetical protein